ncbi:MAG: hypothetical protein OXC10_05745 [Rhodospirillaceae bacterium]|nr:hypothetical protein [Rhodospirillaceae bacterium]
MRPVARAPGRRTAEISFIGPDYKRASISVIVAGLLRPEWKVEAGPVAVA